MSKLLVVLLVLFLASQFNLNQERKHIISYKSEVNKRITLTKKSNRPNTMIRLYFELRVSFAVLHSL